MLEPNIGFHEMIERADAAVETLTTGQVKEKMNNQDVLIVDIRDVRELEREGRIPGSKHVPRGMLEFWIHPDSPYFKDYFDQVGEIVLHCNRGWRSAMAARALKDIGIEVAHMAGGYGEWVKQGLPTEKYERR